MHKLSAFFSSFVLLLSVAGHASQPEEGDAALFLSNVFNESNVAFDALGLPGGPTFHAGIFLSERFMPYASLRVIDHEEGTNLGFGVGSRIYTGRQAPLRTYFDANISYTKLDNIGGQQANALAGAQTNTAKIVSGGAFFGAEYLFSRNASVGAQVGATYSDYGDDFDFTTLDMGTAELKFNLYF